MSAKPKQDSEKPRAESGPQAPVVPDPRDATIERLERAVADERQRAAELRKTVDELRFKIEILEKSYSKQLADARALTAAAEQNLADQTDRLTELDAARQQAVKDLAAAEARLDMLKYTRSSSPTGSGAADGLPALPADLDAAIESSPQEGTINQLLDDVQWLRKQPRKNEERSELEGLVSTDDESSTEDMLAPELVFSAKDEQKRS
jgi:DNA repair exonuclease SbcCD ATPase subunit